MRSDAVAHLRALQASVGSEYKITSREQEVAIYIVFGFGSKEIARRLNVTTRTIEFHSINIYRKVGCNCRSDLLMKMLLQGLIRLEEITRMHEKILLESTV